MAGTETMGPRTIDTNSLEQRIKAVAGLKATAFCKYVSTLIHSDNREDWKRTEDEYKKYVDCETQLYIQYFSIVRHKRR